MDRFFRGLVAGIAGGVVMNTFNLFSYYVLDFARLRFLDWTSIMVFGDRPHNIVQTLMALGTHLMWAGFLGIIMAMLFPVFTSRGYLIKGAFVGFVIGFILYAIPVLFSVRHLQFTATQTALSNMIGGLLWGITTAYVLHYLDTSPRVKS